MSELWDYIPDELLPLMPLPPIPPKNEVPPIELIDLPSPSFFDNFYEVGVLPPKGMLD